MKSYLKEYCKRGIVFGGLGPIICGIVYMIIDFTGVDLKLEGWQILLAIVSSYILAFVQAGSSVFEQIEEWSSIKALFWHLLSIYLVYLLTYFVNRWIPFSWLAIVTFSAAIILGFLLIWIIIYVLNRRLKNKLNSKLN